jgi:ion channel-forming bestrophin family protein
MIAPLRRRLLLDTARYLGWPLLFVLAYDVLVVVVYKAGFLHWAAFHQIPVTLLGSIVSILVAFRNSTSYSRWWEARTLWGSIVNNSRSWGRQVTTAVRPASPACSAETEQTQRKMVYYQIAWVNALRQHLRHLEPWEQIAPFLSPEELASLRSQRNIPVAIQQWQSTLLRDLLDRRCIDITQWRAMDESLNDLVDAQGGAERIKNTPMPRQYDYLPKLCVQIFCILLPLAMGANMGWFTPLGSALVGFIFLSLDRIGRDLEDPFDNTINDIPLTAMCRTIEVNLRQMLGEAAPPPDERPVDGILW